MPDHARLTKFEWAFAILGALAMMLLLWVATSRYGLGVSSDSTFYLSSAENFAKGKGFTDFENNPLLFWPPLYPFILSLVHIVTRLSLLDSGKVINTIAYGLIVLSSAVMYKRCFSERILWFYLGTLATLLFLPILTMAANIGTDLLFFLLVALFILVSQNLLVGKSMRSLWLLSLLAACIALLRWVGVVFVLAEVVIVFISYREDQKRAIINSIIFGCIALIPFLAWVLGRNYLQYGTLFGSWAPISIMGKNDFAYSGVNQWGNVYFTYTRISQWIFPHLLTDRIPAFIIWLVLFVVLLLVNRREHWANWIQRWAANEILPIPIYSSLYLIAITFTVITGDHLLSEYYDDRYQSPLFYALLVGFFITLDELVLVHVKPDRKKLAEAIIGLLFIVWLFYPATLIYKFSRLSFENGVVAYNLYNTKEMNESGLAKFLREHPLESGITVYSNTAEAVYLITGRPVQSSPIDRENYYAVPETLKANYLKWPDSSQAYLIWFNTNQKRNYYSPQDLRQISSMKKLYDGPDGQVLIAAPK